MKWRVYLSSALLVFLSLCFGSFIINQKNNTFALSDLSEIYSDSNMHTICASGPGWNGFTSCDGYKYIIIENIDMTNTGAYLSWNASYNFGDIRLVNATKVIINKSLQTGDYIRFSMSNYSSGSYKVTVTDSIFSCPGAPSGSITLTENGTFDVTNYAEAVVDVPPEVVQGDYHDDLVSLKQAIVIVPAVALVIYFLYAIYKMLLGGKTL